MCVCLCVYVCVCVLSYMCKLMCAHATVRTCVSKTVTLKLKLRCWPLESVDLSVIDVPVNSAQNQNENLLKQLVRCNRK